MVISKYKNHTYTLEAYHNYFIEAFLCGPVVIILLDLFTYVSSNEFKIIFKTPKPLRLKVIYDRHYCLRGLLLS